MRDDELLKELLEADDEKAVLEALTRRELLSARNLSQWKYLGGMPNNQSIVHAQQSSPAAALVEKYTNAADALLLRQCKSRGVDPRSPKAPHSMAGAVEEYFGDLTELPDEKRRAFAESNLLLYATGSKQRPSLSIYDNGEGQLPEAFPTTFCSLIHGEVGSYKGAIRFVQGRFNMGGTGVLPFSSPERKLQLVVSRVPSDVAKGDKHEWAYTLFCFFESRQDPSWKYLVGPDGKILTAGRNELGLIPKLGAKSGEISRPRERKVASGTLIKLYEFETPRSNICGELYKKINEYLLRPALPMRIVECRESYKAKVTRVTVWDRLGSWPKEKLEKDFEDGASIAIQLRTGEVVPAEIRVFKSEGSDDEKSEAPQTGVRALINGQSHASKDSHFFRTKAVDKEQLAGSMLVTLDCTNLGQGSRNAIFMSNRENFREDPLTLELLKGLQRELHDHEGLKALNDKRFADKIKNAVDNEIGLDALEELLAKDPTLAELFGSEKAGRVAAKTAAIDNVGSTDGPPVPFEGLEYPTFFRRKDGSTSVWIDIPRGDVTRVSFLTDVKNNYFSRRKGRGTVKFSGTLVPFPTYRLFNGRLTITCAADKSYPEFSSAYIELSITDTKRSGPFKLRIDANIVPPREEKVPTKRPKQEPKADAAPSRPEILEVERRPEDPPLTVERESADKPLKVLLNVNSELLEAARKSRPKEEAPAVDFVFKYGLALVAMSLLDRFKKQDDWASNEADLRDEVSKSCSAIARVIVPLCLSLPRNLPKAKAAA